MLEFVSKPILLADIPMLSNLRDELVMTFAGRRRRRRCDGSLLLSDAGRHHRPGDHQRGDPPAAVFAVDGDCPDQCWSINTFVPFFSFGEDFKMLMDCGLATILICGLLLAVWTSSTSIADEIEGKTAMTLLVEADQPAAIHRRANIVGIMAAVFWLLLPVMVCFLGLVYYKVGYDSRETAALDPEATYKLADHAASRSRVDFDLLRNLRADGDQRGDFDPRADGRQHGDVLGDFRGRARDIAHGRDRTFAGWKWCSSWPG